MDYFKNSFEYLKNILADVKITMNKVGEILSILGEIISTIGQILGFIGLKVSILLFTTAFIVWLLNIFSPLTRKTNYTISFCLVLWLAFTTKMAVNPIIIKYILIIISPLMITQTANFLIKYNAEFFKFVLAKIKIYFSSFDFSIFKKTNKEIKELDNISILLSNDLPTIQEIDSTKEYIKSINYNLILLEEEKISLTDDDEKIIFNNDLKVNQLINSIKNKNIKLLWFWSQFYGASEILRELNKVKKIKQNKDIIGCKDNSSILNFLQQNWGWNVIYGDNLKDFILNKKYIKEIYNYKYELSLINDYILENNFLLKEKMVGGDLSSIISSIGTKNELNIRNKILFIDGVFENEKVLYKNILHLSSFIIDNNIKIKAIVFGNLILQDNSSISSTIQIFNDSLKNSKIVIPFFKIKEMNFLRFGAKNTIKYIDNKIALN